jgi:hypothetical protein
VRGPADGINPPKPPAPGIPDRTLTALLRQLSAEKGDSVALIFDCCHSSHSTRNSHDGFEDTQLSIRGLSEEDVAPTDPRIDEDIWKDGGADIVSLTDNGFGTRGAGDNGATHVLLAACGGEQEACDDETGGIFTTQLLKVLLEQLDGEEWTNEATCVF